MVTFLAFLGALIVFVAMVIVAIAGESNDRIRLAQAREDLTKFEALDRYEAIAAELRRRGILKLVGKRQS